MKKQREIFKESEGDQWFLRNYKGLKSKSDFIDLNTILQFIFPKELSITILLQ